MAMSLTSAGKLSIPFEDGGPTAPIDLGLTFTIGGRADFSRVYDASVTDDPVNLGTLAAAGAKGVIVKCSIGSCTIKFNGGLDAWPLDAAAGFFLWLNSARAFPTAALISTTGPATVLFLAVG